LKTDKHFDSLIYSSDVVFGDDDQAPFTEELVFRACMIPLLLCGGFKMSTIIFLSPVFFSLGKFLYIYIM
jgi:hypothetical protein